MATPSGSLAYRPGSDEAVQRGGDLGPPTGGIQFLLPQLLLLPLSPSLLAVDKEELPWGGGGFGGKNPQGGAAQGEPAQWNL
jgi:hypothetical protein